MAIFTAIGTAIAGSALFLGIKVSSIIAGALAFGTQLFVSYLTRPKKRAYSAVQGERQYGGRTPATAMFGKGKVAGHHIYYAKWGSGDKFNADVFLLSNGWCDGLEEEIYFFGEKHDLVPRTIIGNEVEHWGVDGFGDKISIRFYDGRPGQGPDTKLVSDTANLGQNWKSTSVCAGMAYVVVEREYDEELFEDGEPRFEFVLRGLREYDPRKDDTVAGGSGSHRLNDPATWEWTENPAVHRLNYQLGLRGLISNRTLIGEGKSLGQLDLNSYFAAMNVCDTERDGHPTYACSLFVTGDDDHTEVLKEFDDAMAGYGMNRRGLSGVIPGAPQTPVMEITADDIDMGRAKQIRHRKSAFDLYNHLSGQFISPESNWEPESLDPIFVNADVSADGRVRQTSNDFLQVTHPDIAEYLLQIRYRQNRMGGSATLPVSRRVGLQVLEGEWINYAGKTWLITNWHIDEEFQFTLTLAETHADVYSEDGIVPGPIIVPPTPPVNPSLLSTVQNFDVEAGVATGAQDSDVPVLRFTWTPPADPSITQVRFFYKVDDGNGAASETELMRDSTDDPEAGEYTTTKNVLSGRVYVARATITTVPDRLKTFTPWVTTADATGFLDAFAQVDLEEIQQAVDDATQWFQEPLKHSISQHREIVEQLFVDAREHIDADFENYHEVEKQARELRITYDRITTEYTEEITVVAGELGAAVQRVETLEVRADDPEIGFEALANTASEQLSMIEQNEGAITVVSQRTDTTEAALDGYLGANAVANAFSGQLSLIEANEDSITVVSQRTDTTEAALAGYLGANAVANTFSGHLSLIEANEDGITVVSQRTDTTEAALSGYLGANAVASGFSGQLSMIEANEDAITVVSQRTDTTEAALSGYLGANAVANTFSSQLSMIEANEDEITLVASDVTEVQVALSGYLGSSAVANAFTQHLAMIEANEDSITSTATAVTQVEASLAGVKRWTYIANVPEGGTKLRNQDGSAPLEHSSGNATMGRLYTIEARRITGSGSGSTVARARKPNANDPWDVEVVFTAGNPASNQPEIFIDGDGDPAIRNTADNATDYEVTIEKTSMNTNDARANALGVLALDARVTQNEGDIVATASAVLGVEASVDEVSASGGFKAEVEASPGGGWSNVGMFAREGSSATGAFGQASIFLQARSSGTPRTRAVLVAEQIVFTDGSGFYRPVIIQDGELIADELKVNWANIVNADIQWADIQNVDIGWADIDTAVINNLTVVDGMIPAELITEARDDDHSGSFEQGGTVFGPWVTLAQVNFDNISGNPVMLYYDFHAQVTSTAGGAVEVRLRRNTTVLGIWSDTTFSGGGAGTPSVTDDRLLMIAVPSPGSMNINIQARAWGATGTATAAAALIGQVNRH